MKKRSLAAIGLAGVMMIGMCVPVLAAEAPGNHEWNQGEGTPTVPSSTTTAVTGEVSDTYTVTIPATITEDNLENSGLSVGASNVNLMEGKTLTVSVQSEKVAMKLEGISDAGTDGTNKYDLTLKVDTSELTDVNKKILETTGQSEVTKKLTATGNKAGTLKAGKYSGVIDFEVSLNNAPTA